MNSNKYRQALKTLDKAMYIDSIANVGDYTKDAYISMVQTKIRRYLEIVDEVETEKNALSGETKKPSKNTVVNFEKEDPKEDSAADKSKKKTKIKREKYYYEEDQYSDTFVNTKQESTDFHISKKLRKEKKKSEKKVEKENSTIAEEEPETKKAEDNPEKKKKKVDKKAALIAVPVMVETITIVKDIDASEKKETIKKDKKGLLKKFTK
jgi:hypothetical protein